MFHLLRTLGTWGLRAGPVLLLLLWAAPAGAADAVLYRLFLHDGTTLVSYGDFARVADRVVFSMPIGGLEGGAPRLELVSIPESTIDWQRTDAYAYAARARHYADTRGEMEFGRLSTRVAEALNAVALTEDPARRLALADGARKALAEWPSRNYGYRAADVAQLTALLDEVVSELRVAAGQSRFDLSLVSNTAPPPPVPLLPPPDLRESIAQAFTVARTTGDATERKSLLEAVSDVLQQAAATESWAVALRNRVTSELAVEARTDKAYAELSARILASAEQRAKQGDVRSIEVLVKEVLAADDKLGRRRPQATGALLATLDARLDSARRLRLARDAWATRVEVLRAYQRRVSFAIDQLRRAVKPLEDIRRLAGPSTRALARLASRMTTSGRELALVKAPAELDPIHGMLTSAVQMAERAASTRQNAIRANDMKAAWDASSAAAGALLLYERAREELRRLAAPPGS